MSVAVDKDEGVLMGVCAEFARRSDVEPLLVRVTFSLVTIFLAPVAVPAYILAGLVLNQGFRRLVN